jgi:hypothetical protein
VRAPVGALAAITNCPASASATSAPARTISSTCASGGSMRGSSSTSASSDGAAPHA